MNSSKLSSPCSFCSREAVLKRAARGVRIALTLRRPEALVLKSLARATRAMASEDIGPDKGVYGGMAAVQYSRRSCRCAAGVVEGIGDGKVVT